MEKASLFFGHLEGQKGLNPQGVKNGAPGVEELLTLQRLTTLFFRVK